jgi:glycosyltransferase involved in cell wall biosynthesis
VIKICYIIGQLSRHGAERQLYELLKRLNRESFDPLVVSLSEGGYWRDEIESLNIPVMEIPRKKSREFTRLFRLISVLHSVKPDIVHTLMFSANTYGRGAALLTGVPILIASERNAAEAGRDKHVPEIIIDKLFSFFTDAIICNSSRAATVLLTKYFFSRNRVFTVHNGIDSSDYLRVKPARHLQRTIIGTVGRLYPQKNHQLFLDTARILLGKFPEKGLQFLIVGEGPLETDLRKYAKTLGIDGKVLFAGERTDVAELLGQMTIFVMTSDYEGLSNAIMEAMTAGLPVVATDVGGNSELVINGQTGYLCPQNNARALAERVAVLLDDKKTAEAMGHFGRKVMIDRFGIGKMVYETEKIYWALAAKKNVAVRAGSRVSE